MSFGFQKCSKKKFPTFFTILKNCFVIIVYAYLSYIRKEKYCPATTSSTAALCVTLRVPPLDSRKRERKRLS